MQLFPFVCLKHQYCKQLFKWTFFYFTFQTFCFRTFGICLFFEANVLKDSQFFRSTYYSFNTGGTQANRTSVCLCPKTKIKTMP